MAASVMPIGASAAPALKAPVKVLGLSLSDIKHAVGSGFKQTLAKGMDKNTVALSGTTASQKKVFDLHGFESGYLTTFGRIKPTSFKNGKVTVVKGVSSASSLVFSFKDSSGPSWAISYASTAVAKAFKNVKSMKFHLTGQSGLGDKALLMTTSTAISPTFGAVTTTTFIWRRGSYLAEVNLGAYGSVSMSQALGLAKLVDSRIDHLG
jgi:hypothetical protein